MDGKKKSNDMFTGELLFCVCSLSGCAITVEGFTSLASALSSNASHLRELDLSYNDAGDSGMKLLLAGLKEQLDSLRYGENVWHRKNS